MYKPVSQTVPVNLKYADFVRGERDQQHIKQVHLIAILKSRPRIELCESVIPVKLKYKLYCIKY